MHESQLDTPADRFLSLCLQHALTESWLSPEDFNQQFSAATIMEALEADDELRSQLLIEAAGVHEKIAARKSISAAAEDLQLALDEGLCTPETILEIVTVDDHVHFLDRHELWSFLIRDHFWKQGSERARERMLYMLNTAMELELIDLSRLILVISPAEFARLLPRNLLDEAFTAALQSGLDGRVFGADPFVALVPITAWLQHIPLEQVWQRVIVGEIANTANLTERAGSGPLPGGPPPAKAKTPSHIPPPPPSALPESPVLPPSMPPALPSASVEEEEARAQALYELELIDRLPVRAASLSTPVLLALEAMYAEFFNYEEEEDQAECIRDAFPNEKLLEEGLLALAETLDPRLSEEQLKSRGADASSLLQLVLFEERRIARHQSSNPPSMGGSSAAPPPLPSAIGSTKRGSVPPPPPPGGKVSIPPPPLPTQANRRK